MLGKEMNKFIGGQFDGQEMPFDDFVGEVFYAANIGDDYKVPYFKNIVEREGTSYTFWVVDGMGEEEAAIKIEKYFF